MKLACVVHRFGADIAGGSEGHCRAIAERLAARHDVTVLTTTAKDHISWANAYPAGESAMGPLRVHRFPVAQPRSLHRFAALSEVVFSGRASRNDQEEWFRANGPEAPALLEFLAKRGATYDRLLFWSFRYYQTYFGLPLVADRAVLLPTAEEDPAMRLDVLDPFFAKPAGFLFLTPEERGLVQRRSSHPLAPSCVIGAGLDPVSPERSPTVELEALGVAKPYVLYLGRVNPNKGCRTLVEYFQHYRAMEPNGVPLVLAGPVNMPLPEDRSICALGFVSDTAREALLSQAAVLVVPSRFESLSLALLEAWNHGVPALVNGRCAVLRGQALRADGALYYRGFGEFFAALTYLLGNALVSRRLGEQGLAYVNHEYRWPHVMAKIENFLSSPNLSAAAG